jgi:hypothetical protein
MPWGTGELHWRDYPRTGEGVSPLNESQFRRDRYTDELRASGRDGAAAYDEFMPDALKSAKNGGMRTQEMYSRAKDSVQRGIAGATDYVKSHDVDDVLEDARTVARRNPRIAIVALVAVGFLIGRLMRRPR